MASAKLWLTSVSPENRALLSGMITAFLPHVSREDLNDDQRAFFQSYVSDFVVRLSSCSLQFR